MKLELKHLAPYLPYDLKVKYTNKYNHSQTITLVGIMNYTTKGKGIQVELCNKNLIHFFSKIEGIKPILRPLSDLTKEIEVNGEKFVPHIKLGGRPNLKDYDIEYLSKNIDNMSYGLVSKLIEWHFDVFGLFEKDLAIDINSLPQSSE